MVLKECLHHMVHLCHIAVLVLLVKEMLLEGYVTNGTHFFTGKMSYISLVRTVALYFPLA
jgi:hypothetical protein